MTIPVNCPECGELHRLKDELAGKKFACRKCGTAVRIPNPQHASAPQEPIDFEVPAAKAPASPPDEYDWNTPLNDAADGEPVDDLPALPQVVRKKKPKARQVAKDDDDDDDESPWSSSSSSSGWTIAGFPIPIAISLGCTGILWLWGAYYIYGYLSGERPWSALMQILRVAWLSWLMYDLSNGAMRARYLSILDSISGLTWVAVAWTVFIPLMALSPIVKDHPWLMTLFYFSAAAQGTLWTTNIIALCWPSAAEYCSEWEGG